MITPEMLRLIRHEIRTHINVILNATAGKSESCEEQELLDIVPGADSIGKRPVAHPYGLVSRAPAEKLALTARIGEHPGARIILAFRDRKRADIEIEEGECCLYNEFGQKIVLAEDKVLIGDNADEPAVLGNVCMEMLGKILDILIQGQIGLTTSPGNPTAPNPVVTPQLQAIKTQYLDTVASNIVSQETFVRRTP